MSDDLYSEIDEVFALSRVRVEFQLTSGRDVFVPCTFSIADAVSTDWQLTPEQGSIQTQTPDPYQSLGIQVKDIDIFFSYCWEWDQVGLCALLANEAKNGATLILLGSEHKPELFNGNPQILHKGTVNGSVGFGKRRKLSYTYSVYGRV